MLNHTRGDGFFSYTKSELRGLLVLFLLLAGVLIVRYWICSRQDNFSLVITDITEDTDQEFSGNTYQVPVPERPPSAIVAKIDPNTASESELLRLGLSSRAVRNLILYREKGGRFNTLHDLYKVYGIDTMYIDRINTLFRFQNQSFPDLRQSDPAIAHTINLELNSADSAQLIKLPGIGSVLAKRIIRYRDILGGFYSVSQLNEVYGIDDSLTQSLRSYVHIDTALIERIDLNRATLEQLQNHPYITSYQAKAILSYRRITGLFKSSNELINNYLIPEDIYYRFTAYISLN